MECSICYNPIIDKVFMTCSSQHPFCFKCLLQNVEANSELKSCPNCRGGDKFIMLTNETIPSGTGFYSLDYFKKSLPILQKILGDSVTANTCLISELILVCYVKNKKQLNIAHKLISSGDSIDDIVPFIKWDEKRSLEDIGIEVVGGLVDFFTSGTPMGTPMGMPPGGPTNFTPFRQNTNPGSPNEQRQRRTNTDREDRGDRRGDRGDNRPRDQRGPRILFGSGLPPPDFIRTMFGNGGGNVSD
jgi:hypothetical protein